MLTKQDHNYLTECVKLFYMQKFNKKALTEPSDFDKIIMEEGVEVGKVARNCFGKYKLIDRDHYDPKMCADMTKVYMDMNTNAIAEASFIAGDLFCAVDVLLRNPEGGYDIYEVKASAHDEKEYLMDVAFQYYVLQKAGVDVKNAYILHVNGNYVKDGPLDYSKLFVREEKIITPDIIKQVELDIDIMRKLMKDKKEPETVAKSGCRKCAAHNACYKDLPKNNVWDIAGLRTAAKIYNEVDGGKASFKEIYEAYKSGKSKFKLSDKQIMQIEYELKSEESLKENLEKADENITVLDSFYKDYGTPEEEKVYLETREKYVKQKEEIEKQIKEGSANRYVDYDSLKVFMDTLQYPVYHLDFETINPAIPNVDGYKPYQARINQYSLHVQKHKGDEEKDLVHKEYLQESLYDNTMEVVDRLIDDLGEQGSIVVYTKFENERLGELEEMMKNRGETARAEAIASIRNRLWDLSKIFENGWIYDRGFKGLYSIKKVLPVMSKEHDEAYPNLPLVHNGTEDMYWYKKLCETPIGSKEHEYIKKCLLMYCGLDTLAEYAVLAEVEKILDRHLEKVEVKK